MNKTFANKLTAQIVGNSSTSSAQVSNTSISMADFGKWWKGIEPRHKIMILLGAFIILTGIIDIVFYLFTSLSLLFWANDILVIFGGFILVQIGLSFAIRSSK